MVSGNCLRGGASDQWWIGAAGWGERGPGRGCSNRLDWAVGGSSGCAPERGAAPVSWS